MPNAASIRPGRPAPAMGTGTAAMPLQPTRTMSEATRCVRLAGLNTTRLNSIKALETAIANGEKSTVMLQGSKSSQVFVEIEKAGSGGGPWHRGEHPCAKGVKYRRNQLKGSRKSWVLSNIKGSRGSAPDCNVTETKCCFQDGDG